LAPAALWGRFCGRVTTALSAIAQVTTLAYVLGAAPSKGYSILNPKPRHRSATQRDERLQPSQDLHLLRCFARLALVAFDLLPIIIDPNQMASVSSDNIALSTVYRQHFHVTFYDFHITFYDSHTSKGKWVLTTGNAWLAHVGSDWHVVSLTVINFGKSSLLKMYGT
jgi:hypothetical protein